MTSQRQVGVKTDRIRSDIGQNHIRIHIFLFGCEFPFGYLSDAKFSLPYPLKMDSDIVRYFFEFGYGLDLDLDMDIIRIIIYTSTYI